MWVMAEWRPAGAESGRAASCPLKNAGCGPVRWSLSCARSCVQLTTESQRADHRAISLQSANNGHGPLRSIAVVDRHRSNQRFRRHGPSAEFSADPPSGSPPFRRACCRSAIRDQVRIIDASAECGRGFSNRADPLPLSISAAHSWNVIDVLDALALVFEAERLPAPVFARFLRSRAIFHDY